MRIDIQLRHQHLVFENRYDDFGLDLQTARQIILLPTGVLDEESLAGRGCLPTNAFAKRDLDMFGRFAGIRPEMELVPVIIGNVETHPIVMFDSVI